MTGAFTLDRFQLEAISALDEGRSVLVAAPTGSGKTVVAEAAIDIALHSGGKVFYTTPIKALSNQKYADLVRRLGAERVGLLTGDNSVNGDAPVVVMTTEVLRNMLYAASRALDDLHYVVLDEVHYLQDAYRGPVWEEVIIGLPPMVRLVCLSATVSNADELGSWLEAVRGATTTIVETERPVDLHPLYLVGDRASEREHLLPILVDGRPNPDGERFDTDPRLPRAARNAKFKVAKRFFTPRRIETVERLRDEDLLPAIYFIFSRNACDDAMAAARDTGLRLTDPSERVRIVQIIEQAVAGLSDADLDVLGYDLWAEALAMGIASHHAGLIPAFKEAAERCFTEGLVKVVFATETLTLGINMPARSVVIEKLSKYNGDTHEFLTPGEFTQLTGRAGRRGIDETGYAVILWSPFSSFEQVATLAASRSFPLRSSFRPTYNMAANLVRRYDRADAMALLGQSFAQFQADRELVSMQRRLLDDQRHRDDLLVRATCELGDATAFADLHDRARSERRHRADGRVAIERSLSLLRPGDVIDVPDADDSSAATRLAVISVAYRARGAIRVRGVDTAGGLHHVEPRTVSEPIRSADNLELPSPYAPHDPGFLDETARRLAACTTPALVPTVRQPSRWERLVAEVEAHPVHACPDREAHLDAQRTLTKLDREIATANRRLTKRSGSVVRRFEAVLDVLSSLGFVREWELTESGERLAQTYHECDLLVALALDDGVFDGLDTAATAGVAAALTYEERRPDSAPKVSFPTATLRRRFERLERLWHTVNRAEKERGLPQMRAPDGGFVTLAHGWAAGRELGWLLEDSDMSGGDFVRNTKLTIDLLRQVATAAPDLGTRTRAGAAADALFRGVVATEATSLTEVNEVEEP